MACTSAGRNQRGRAAWKTEQKNSVLIRSRQTGITKQFKERELEATRKPKSI